MDSVTTAALGSLPGVLAVLAAGPGVAAVLLWRMRRRDARRRAAAGFALLRSPGHSARARLEAAQAGLAADILALCAAPLAALAVGQALAPVGAAIGAGPAVLAPGVARGLVLGLVLGLVPSAWLAWRTVHRWVRIDALRAEVDAEVAVGQELDQLMRAGAAVFHDVPADGFNIDHVVVSAQGVFAVETEGHPPSRRGHGRAGATVVFDGHVLAFPTWRTSEPLERAERQARWLSKWATGAVGGMVVVTPVLALPGWYVDPTGRSNVRVYSGRALGSLLNTPSKQPLSDGDLQRIAHQVAQRCRTEVLHAD